MLVSHVRNKVVKKKENEVTSHIILEPHRKQTKGNLKLYDDGIFSKRIFGNFGRCDCGNLMEEGICDQCGVRVISEDNIPDFYVDLTVPVLAMFPDLSHSGLNPKDAESVLNYQSFLYRNELIALEDALEHPENFHQEEIHLGVDALIKMGVSKSWISENTTDYVSIPHPAFRPLIMDYRGLPFVTSINQTYSDLIKSVNTMKEMGSFIQGRSLYSMVQYKEIALLYQKVMQELLDELINVNYSIMKSEIIAHPISGAVRSVLINRHDVHEDVAIIGDTMVETLWPYLFKKHKGNMYRINKELVDKGSLILINRPPSISHLSIMAMKPRIASCYPLGKMEGTQGGLLNNDRWEKESNSIGIFDNQDGDIEKFWQELEDGIDTLGLRCLGMNPITFDGLASDTDGDVLLQVAIYSTEATQEAEKLLPSRCYINYANGSIRNHIIEDFIFVEE